jgi:asparagine synthase (glutamine-hydrolysing)
MGGLPCYWACHEGLVLAASDLSVMIAAGLPRPAVDPAALARQLAAGDLITGETCLAGIGEIQGGERLTFGPANIERTCRWSPWAFAAPPRTPSREDAAGKIREAAIASVAAIASQCSGLLLKLSGGLDSSIVAACLAEAGVTFTALNLVIRDTSGDERPYAREVARHLGMPLVEAWRDARQVEVERSAAARLPRPSARSFLQESARIAAELAARAGAGALLDGGGGDNVFCSLQSARPAADCLFARATLGQFVATARSIAELAPASLLEVCRRAWSIRSRTSPAYRWPFDLRFLSSEASPIGEQAARHPWLDPPAAALPGKAAHVAMIAAAQSVAEGFDAEDDLPTWSPLIAQPVVEACLEAPSWMWFEHGRNRALARRAFAGRLPPRILERRSKGAPDSFIAELFVLNRATIKDMLLGGKLRSLGLLDCKALDEALAIEGPVKGHDFLRIMKLFDAEAWARCWP